MIRMNGEGRAGDGCGKLFKSSSKNPNGGGGFRNNIFHLLLSPEISSFQIPLIVYRTYQANKHYTITLYFLMVFKSNTNPNNLVKFVTI